MLKILPHIYFMADGAGTDAANIPVGGAAPAPAPAAPAPAAPAVADPAFANLDVNDQIANLNTRLTALENHPAVSSFSDTFVAGIKHAYKRIFGDDLE